MTTVTLNSSDSRHAKAILLVADSGQWLRPKTSVDGHRVFGIPSQRVRGLYHWADLDGRTCTCQDWVRRALDCKHITAARLYVVAHPEQSAWDTVDGLRKMLAARYDAIYESED